MTIEGLVQLKGTLLGNRYRVIFIVSILFSLLILSCSSSPHYKKGTLRIYKQAEVHSLDPILSNDVTSGEICALIYDGLVRFDDRLQVVPNVARDWTISQQGTLYTFYLRHDVFFSNGRMMTSHDVNYSIMRVLHPKSKSSRKWLFDIIDGAHEYYYGESEIIKGIHIPNDSTIVITLKEPSYLFLQFLAMPAASIVPREEVERWGDDFGAHPVGSGPWKLDRWEYNSFMQLVTNQHYFGTAPRLDTVVYRIIPEIMTATSEFEVGNLDIMKVPDAEFERWAYDPLWKKHLHTQQKLAVVYIGLNNQKPLFKNKKIRRALNYAVDIEEILKTMLQGRGERAYGAIPGILLGNEHAIPKEKYYSYDPPKARALLAEAGYEKGFKMDIWQKHNPETGRILEAVQAYYADVGVNVTIVTRDWNTLKQAVNKGEPDAFFLDWYGDYPDAENFLFPLFYSSNWGGEGNRARYWNAVVDSLLDVARVSQDSDVRIKLYAHINSLVYEDAPWVFLWHPRVYVVTQAWVENYHVPPIFNGSKLLKVAVVSP